jgi:hypothetical protein
MGKRYQWGATRWDYLKKPWRAALDSLEFDPMARIHELRHCWKT